MRAIPQAAIDLVVAQETPILWVYDDAKGAHHADGSPRTVAPGDDIAGVLTAGTGHTGPDVVIGMTVDQALNDRWLLEDLGKAAKKLVDRIGQAVVDMLTENQYAALLDFVFNVGADPSWTIWKRLVAKQFAQVPLELAKFVNAKVNGVERKIPDLVRRRNAEIELFGTDEPGSRDVQIPSSVLRNSITPPTPADPVPASKSKALILGGLGTIAERPADDKPGEPSDSALCRLEPLCAAHAGRAGDPGGGLRCGRPGVYLDPEAQRAKLRKAIDMNGTELKAKFDTEWGAFRKYIAAHPLTGFWCGVGAGVIGGALLRGLL